MIKKLQTSLFICLLSATAVALALPAAAQEKKAEGKEKTEKSEKKREAYPFTGKITAVDKVNMTISLNGTDGDRVFHITSATKINKGGKPATTEDAVVGDEAAGTAHKVDGKVEALTIRLGPKPEGAGEKKKKEKKEEKKEEKK